MKKLLIFASMVLGMVPVAFAQQQHNHQNHSNETPAQKAQKAGDKWQKKLGLSDDEKTKFVTAKTAYETKVQELRKTKPVDKTAVAAAKTDFENAVKAAFTADHYASWQKAKEEQEEKHAEKKGHHGQGGGTH